jgi:hypothetical protein
MKVFNPILCLTLFALVACQQMNDELLIGRWQAVSLTEEGEPVPVDMKEISFEFRADQTYRYSSTLNYREAGDYYVETRFLYTTDTINQASTEKAVEILMLSEDSLHLGMLENGKERVLKLTRGN